MQSTQIPTAPLNESFDEDDATFIERMKQGGVSPDNSQNDKEMMARIMKLLDDV